MFLGGVTITTARETLNKKKWAVVGDVTNESKYAYDIVNVLVENSHMVYKIDPRGSKEPGVLKSLKEVPGKIDIVNLVVRPTKGIEIVKEMKDLGLGQVFIQPGASSQEIMDYCLDNDIEVIKGCVLVEYRNLMR